MGIAVHVTFVLIETVLPALPEIIGLRMTMFAVMMISGTAGLLFARDWTWATARNSGRLLVGWLPLSRSCLGLALTLRGIPLLWPLSDGIERWSLWQSRTVHQGIHVTKPCITRMGGACPASSRAQIIVKGPGRPMAMIGRTTQGL